MDFDQSLLGAEEGVSYTCKKESDKVAAKIVFVDAEGTGATSVDTKIVDGADVVEADTIVGATAVGTIEADVTIGVTTKTDGDPIVVTTDNGVRRKRKKEGIVI